MHTRKTVLVLQTYAQQMTTLTTPDQTTILDHINLTNQALGAIEQVLPRPTDPLRASPTLAVSERRSLRR